MRYASLSTGQSASSETLPQVGASLRRISTLALVMLSPAPVRVLLADDQPKVRSALRLLIEQELAFSVVGEAGAADELVRGILTNDPHIVLLDWELPGLPDAHKLDRMRLIDPAIHVIVLSGQPEARQPALAEGADMFVSKADPPDGVLRALYFVHDKI
jgi:DNA-binding NarL/FixJ family response regulator